MDLKRGQPPVDITLKQLELELSEHPYRYDFFQAVRLLENLYPDKARLGRSHRAAEDPVRLEQTAALSFQPSAVTGFEYKKDLSVPSLSTSFFGLFGANGALPLHLSEYADERKRHFNDPTFISFINLFQHRMLSFVYRAWADSQPTVNFDRYQDDRFKIYIGSFLGLGADSLHGRDDIYDNLKLHFAGHFACQHKHPEGLKLILESYFGFKTDILEFVGEWLNLPNNSVCRLGRSKHTGCLGLNTIAGASIWSKQHKFRIIMGPMQLKDYEHILESDSTRNEIIAIVRNYIGFELDWDINLILQHDQVPKARLGSRTRLGWSGWLGVRKERSDANDLVLNIN